MLFGCFYLLQFISEEVTKGSPIDEFINLSLNLSGLLLIFNSIIISCLLLNKNNIIISCLLLGRLFFLNLKNRYSLFILQWLNSFSLEKVSISIYTSLLNFVKKIKVFLKI